MNTFKKWFNDNWINAGGLISKATGADYLNCSITYINKLIANKKIREYKIEKRIYISFLDCNKINCLKTKKQ